MENLYLCSKLENGNCVEWLSFSDSVGLSVADAFAIGGAMLAISALAWGLGLIARTIINR